MPKLMDMCGLVNYDIKTRVHDRERSIYGSILLDEKSNYFEGIVKTYDEKNRYLVFGTFNEEEGFHMYTYNSEAQELNEEISCALQTKKDIAYNGSFKFAEFTTPEVRIIIQDGDIYRDVTEGEISVLQSAINKLKTECNLVSLSKQKIKK